jgi:hypothetical protein
MRLVVGLGILGLVAWGVDRYRKQMRAARLQEWWLKQQASAAE